MDIDPHGGRDPKPEPVGLLSNIRVLDFGRYVAGPYCACLLADLGADVIRIERVEGGEDRLLTPLADNDAGAMFLQVNRNKRGITLDPTTPSAVSEAVPKSTQERCDFDGSSGGPERCTMPDIACATPSKPRRFANGPLAPKASTVATMMSSRMEQSRS